ncbi:hypothetical protein CHH58_13340 [Terribacillus saccharophilus]|uniref:helix-turn-helix domain-containing protein n=1 Tax=Terribacillus saccharophilus TaxID=361277 RepID=UPI000BA5B84A|nr:helix-turn-helix domain-containing protein [Terribacillus saccharophilus]PAF36230.1 hypothetical protein CHH58_13340 [Terribacillus saccharophilus]
MAKKDKEELEYASCYSTLEAAEIMGVPDQTIRSWCEKGEIPDVIRLENRELRIPKSYFRFRLEQAKRNNNTHGKINRSSVGIFYITIITNFSSI